MKPLNEDDPRKLLGGLLRQARAEAGLTQDAIGHAVGVERTGVTRMEGGERLPSRATLGTWLERCGMPRRCHRIHSKRERAVYLSYVGVVDCSEFPQKQ